ncbi:MAG TPA: cell division protein ZapA [Allosphingosinicella sp.]|jgi:cell division protein ZapA|uniref:cell division protein ZapA n=1 Tax=Allosphingosinicella sp. TaxID=2823234 RepID=UPI002F29D2F0
MASVELEVGGRKYTLACRDGEEAHLRSVAAVVDRKAREAASALGNLGEARQLLFASLLLADELGEQRGAGAGAGGSATPAADPNIAELLEDMADRVEMLADRLEPQGANS